MKIVEIPGGQAEIREKGDVKVRHRRIIESAGVAAAPVIAKLDPDTVDEETIVDLHMNRVEAMKVFELQDATIVALLAAWTRPEPLPTMETIEDLDPEVYEALAEATRDIGAVIAQGDSFGPSDPKAEGFEDTPTLPSGD
jgi:hypothetical protein